MQSRIYCLCALCIGLFLAGCVKVTTGQRRVVELPPGHSQSTLANAETICRELIASGYRADVQRRFPSLSPQQLQGLFLTWNEGNFSRSGHTVFIMCGINYTGSLPQAKEVADYCQSLVANAVAAKFPSNAK